MLASMLTGVPFSFSAHARDIYNNASPQLLREKIARAELITTCTRANAEYLGALAPPLPQDKIVVAYHGVNIEKFAYAQPADSPGVIPTILTAARLVEKKGLDDLLRACALLRGKGVSFRCIVIGEGPERRRLELQRRALGLDGVVDLPGACVQEELVARYRAATVFVLPCKVLPNGDRDGIPNVIAEAMASGVPVVSTKVSGVPELIESGTSGLLVPPGNTTELSSAIELLLRDADLRARLARNARARVEADFDSVACARALAARFGWRAAEAVV
jgi:glycosyltransferase involved in cell wall biosynthesis